MVSQSEADRRTWDRVWRLPGRPTRAVVDLDAIGGNLRVVRAGVSPRSRLLAVVKANGYGHGAVMVGRAAVAAGVDHLAVATVQEGMQLRLAGIAEPVLVLGPIDPSEIRFALDHRLSVTVSDLTLAHQIAEAAHGRSFTGPAFVHLKIDTGMRRYGAMPDAATAVAAFVASAAGLKLAGVCTHFACADEADAAPTRRQAALFERCLDEIRSAGIDPGLVHAANSAATLRSRRYDYDMVRLGIAMYGLPPSGEVPLWDGMRPALEIRSRIKRVIPLRPGDRVSYGGTYRADGPERVALVPIGYGDGYHRRLSNRGWMAIEGVRASVRGRVCMDQTVVELPAGVAAGVDGEVVVCGDPARGAPGLEQLAKLAGTIQYELATAVAPRLPRYHVRGGDIVAIEDLGGLRGIDAELENAAAVRIS